MWCFTFGFALGLVLGFVIFGLDWPRPELWLCIRIGKYKLEQWHIYKVKLDENGEYWHKIL